MDVFWGGICLQSTDDRCCRLHFFPSHRFAVIDRPRLTQQAFANDPALIVLRGGGGTGKSVAATQISRAFVERTTNAQAVWVRFTPADADPFKAWQRVLETLSKSSVLPKYSTGSLLASGGVLSLDTAIQAFHVIECPLLLVIDDAHHAIGREMENGILQLLEEMPHVTVMITSRRTHHGLTSTMARIRVPVQKLTAHDLAFTSEEVQALVRIRTHDRVESQGLTKRILQESRGWPLAAHATLVELQSEQPREYVPLHNQRDSGQFVRCYLDGMLQRASEDVRIAMVVIAMCIEVTPPILAEILERSVAETNDLLEEELVEHVDYWADENGNQWYRFHELIARELRTRADVLAPKERIRTYAQRAANAMQEQRPAIALKAAVLAQEWDLVSEILLKGSSLTLSRRNEVRSLAHIPDSVRLEYPIIDAFCLIHDFAFPSGPFGRVMRGLRTLASRRLVDASLQPGLPGLTASILRMVVARLSGSDKTALTLVHQIVSSLDDLTSAELSEYSRSLRVGMNQAAITLIHAARFDDAIALLNRIEAYEDLSAPQSRTHTAALTAWAHAWSGDMIRAREYVEKCEQFTTPIGWRSSYIGAGYRIAAALLDLEAGDFMQARVHIDALAEHESTIEHWPFLVYVETLITESEAGPGAAIQLVNRHLSRRRGRSAPSRFARSFLDSLRARLLWHSGKVIQAQRRRVDPSLSGAIHAMSRGENALASALASTAYKESPYLQFPRERTTSLLLHAESARREGNMEFARELAVEAAMDLKACEMTLPMRVLPHDSAAAIGKLAKGLPIESSSKVFIREIQPLTPSEKRGFLAVIEQGNVPAAAKALYLSPSTLKGYMKNVYRKLGVKSREDAIRVAGEAGLLAQGQDDD